MMRDNEKKKMLLKAMMELFSEASDDNVDFEKYESKVEPVVVAGSTINQAVVFEPPKI